MNLGPTLDITKENLKRYYTLGKGKGTRVEGAVLNRLVNRPGYNLKKLLTHLQSGKKTNVYKAERSTIEKVAEVALLFDQKPFSSFISGTLKQYYPVNLPTHLDEITEVFNDEMRYRRYWRN